MVRFAAAVIPAELLPIEKLIYKQTAEAAKAMQATKRTLHRSAAAREKHGIVCHHWLRGILRFLRYSRYMI